MPSFFIFFPLLNAPHSYINCCKWNYSCQEKGRHSVFLCSLESHSTFKYSDLVICSHWKDFLNSQDLSSQLYGKNRRKETYLGLAVSDDCCCQEKEPKSLQMIGRSPSKRRERGVQENKCFATGTLLKMGEDQLSLNIGIE